MVNTRTDAELAAAVQAAVTDMLPQIREQVREEYRNGASGSGGNPPPVTIHTWLERFNKQKPRTFEKAVTPVDAENWISHMEKIFDVMGCDDVFKARLAVYKFEGDALAWWKAYKQAKGGDAWILTLSWADFKELFFLQFFPRAEQERLKREYHSLRQRAGESSNELWRRMDSHGSGKAGGSGILPNFGLDVDTGTGSAAPTSYQLWFPAKQGHHRGWYLLRDCKKNTWASSSGYADQEERRIRRVFALTQDQAAYRYRSRAILQWLPYRMAPIELKELKDHCMELLERGFIAQVYRHGVHPVLFVKKRTVSLSQICRWGCHELAFTLTKPHAKGVRSLLEVESREKSFVELKLSVCFALFLLSHRFRWFQIYSVASKKGLAVCSHAALGSDCLCITTTKTFMGEYPNHDLELAAVVFSS
ncbi:zinc finger, CCHC-type, retrotransposon gag domain protein [Tanacetum coccineum]